MKIKIIKNFIYFFIVLYSFIEYYENMILYFMIISHASFFIISAYFVIRIYTNDCPSLFSIFVLSFNLQP